MPLLRRAGLLLVALVAIGGCGGGDDDAAGGDAPAATAPGDEAIPAALRFQGTLLGGGQLDGQTLAGEPVLLWFWAPT